jgi:DNA polymerase-3 subunit alpha
MEMRRIFADLPEAIENSSVIARRCAFGAPTRKPILPNLAGDIEAEAEQLRRDARAGLEARLAAAALGEEERKGYFARLDYEVDVIVGMGFPGYFLIVADFIKWAKEKGIPSVRAAARGLGRWSPGRSRSPISIRSSSGSCSSASSTPSACRCPTSTSIFAKRAAAR